VPRPAASSGLLGLRRAGAVTDLLFLEACATLEPTQLRPIAQGLGLTVQAVSHVFRVLRGRGWVVYRDGRYRPTLEGVARLHETLTSLGDDVRRRLGELHVVRSTRAVAAGPLSAGDTVTLEIRDGVLTARRAGGGASRGRVVRGGRAGALVEVGELEGIVPITPAPIRVTTVPEGALADPGLPGRLARELRGRAGPVAVVGLEAYVLARRGTSGTVHRFAPTAVCREASRVGVPSTLVVLERDLPRVLGELAGPSPPPVEVLPVGGPPRVRGTRAARAGARAEHPA
jgi:putative transcriptional regulator